MRNVFNNPELEKEFDKNGYVRVPFITKDKVEKLRQLFFETLPHSKGSILAGETGVDNASEITYDFTFIDKNPDYKRLVFKIITDEFADGMNLYLDNYKPIIANYIRKKTEGGDVPLHQNWAFVNERKYTSVSIWCPLVDSTVNNGTLQVVPGSHKRMGEYRGPMVPWQLDNIKSEIINNHLVPLETKAGEAIILDDSIVHYSAINKTNDLRLAIQLILVPAEAEIIHYHLNPAQPDEIKICTVDQDFFMTFNPWMKPDEALMKRTIPFKQHFYTLSDFEQALNGRKIDELETV